MDPQVEAHVRELASLLTGKNTKKLKSPGRGTALLVLTDAAAAIHRIRIELGPERVEVSEGGASGSSADFAVIRGAWSDWLAFYNAASAETLAPLKFYGEPELMAALGELLTLPRSMVDLRSGGAR
jgi:hypothetical protein